MRHTTPLAFALLVLAAATPPGTAQPASQPPQPPLVWLEVAPESPAPGDSVTLTLRNGSEEVIGYNLCTASLVRFEDMRWIPAQPPPVCTMEIRTLPAGEEASYRTRLPTTIEPGTYRFRTQIEWLWRRRHEPVSSRPFMIARQ